MFSLFNFGIILLFFICILTLLFVFCLFYNYFAKKKTKQKQKKTILEKHQIIEEIFKNKNNEYTKKIDFKNFSEKVKLLKELFEENRNLFSDLEQNKFSNLIADICQYQNHEDFNHNFLEKKKQELPQNFFDLKSIKLDDNQVDSILKEDKINLVIAGAGSGKTTTIIGKIKYLVEVCGLNPSQILVLSYGNKAVDDFNSRFKNFLDYDVKAKTIHAFSHSISSNIEDEKKNAADQNTVKESFTEAFLSSLDNKDFIYWWIEFIAYWPNGKISDEEIEEIWKGKIPPVMMENEYIMTLKGENVKSFDEAKIANFFYLNNVEYEYEKEYGKDTKNASYATYKPDFYLSKSNIYWEHFGFNENYETMWKHTNPAVDKKYYEKWMWKIDKHKKEGTKLIQSFSFELRKNDWQKILISKLVKNNIAFSHKFLTKEEIKNMINKNKDVRRAVKLFSSLFNLYEEYELTESILKSRLAKITNKVTFARTELFLKIFFIVWNKFQEILKTKRLITFATMIKKGYENLSHYQSKYRYLIIDEFQDISPLRMKFINKLIKEQHMNKFYFVGDDWQSIYGFNGSQVDLFTNLKDDNNASVTFIKNTYRNSQELLEITSRFVTKDKNMLKKSLMSKKTCNQPIIIYEYEKETKSNGNKSQACIIEQLIKFHFDENSNYEFLILARTIKSKEAIFINKNFYQSKESERHNNLLKLTSCPEAKIKFATVHKSKGLEADFVFVMNVSNNIYGLPCQIFSDNIMSFFDLSTKEKKNDEERRIFYVALTRTKNIVYLLTENENYSLFIKELVKDEPKISLKIINQKKEKYLIEKCPTCDYKLKNNEKIVFCPNNEICRMIIAKKSALTSKAICFKCGWFCEQKNGIYGNYYRCFSCREKNSCKK